MSAPGRASGDAATVLPASRFVDRLAELCEEGALGKLVVIERAAPKGFMPPLHRHDEDETFRVLKGEVTFFVGECVLPAAAGDVVEARARVARTFRVDSDARWLVLTRVKSLDDFDDFGRAVSCPSAEPSSSGWNSSEDAALVTAIGRINGIEILGPPGTLPGRGQQ